MPKLIVALHDVTPAHAERLDRAERLFDALGISQVAYLLVPAFHGSPAANESAAFIAWCRRPRRFGVQWVLHGYFHDERAASHDAARRLSPAEWLGSKLLTDREAEFLRLRGRALDVRIDVGVTVFEHCIGESPTGFIAPAWLFNDELLPVLRRRSFHFTESQLRVFHVPSGITQRSPVITWSTRTWLRRHGSTALAAARRYACAGSDVVRVALHPFDFDHHLTVASIARTLDQLRAGRTLAAYNDDLFGRAHDEKGDEGNGPKRSNEETKIN